MRRSTDADRLTVKDIIDEIVSSMERNIEQSHRSWLAPSMFYVYLSEDDYERLSGIIRRIIDDAEKALDDRIEELNGDMQRGLRPFLHLLYQQVRSLLTRVPAPIRPAFTRKLRSDGEISRPSDGWQISFHCDETDEQKPGKVRVITSHPPPRKDLGGMKTDRIGTSSAGRESRGGGAPRESKESPSTRQSQETTRANPRTPERGPHDSLELVSAQPAVRAKIRYRDRSGEHVYEMTKSEIVIGRGGPAFWVDIQLDVPNEVSREHLRIRWEKSDGRFHLKDISSRGTTINGSNVPAPQNQTIKARAEGGDWVRLPGRARLGLAGVIFLDFEAQ